MIRSFLKYFIVFVLLVLSGWNLMNVSAKVQKLERDIAVFDRKIAVEQERIRVLKAEWAYLNDPARLEAVASSVLGLEATKGKAVLSKVDSIPEYNENLDPAMLSSSIPVSYGYNPEGGRR